MFTHIVSLLFSFIETHAMREKLIARTFARALHFHRKLFENCQRMRIISKLAITISSIIIILIGFFFLLIFLLFHFL